MLIAGNYWRIFRIEKYSESANPMFQKTPRIELPKYLAAARGQSCVRPACGINNGTTIPAHYSGKFSNLLGKGRGIKCHDLFIADLCDGCHQYFDGYKSGNDDSRAAEFMICVHLTILRRWQAGVIGMVKK